MHIYYGRQGSNENLKQNVCDFFIKENNEMIKNELSEIEERLKRHITECKHSIIKEIQKSSTKEKKEHLDVDTEK